MWVFLSSPRTTLGSVNSFSADTQINPTNALTADFTFRPIEGAVKAFFVSLKQSETEFRIELVVLFLCR